MEGGRQGVGCRDTLGKLVACEPSLMRPRGDVTHVIMQVQMGCLPTRSIASLFPIRDMSRIGRVAYEFG